MSSKFDSKPQLFYHFVQARIASKKGDTRWQGEKTIFPRLSFRARPFGANAAINKLTERRIRLARKVQNDLRAELEDLEPLVEISTKGQHKSG